jgi:hypothetical protein
VNLHELQYKNQVVCAGREGGGARSKCSYRLQCCRMYISVQDKWVKIINNFKTKDRKTDSGERDILRNMTIKLFGAEFSTLSLAVLLNSHMSAQYSNSHS